MAINQRLQRLLDVTRSSYAVLPHDEVYTARDVADSVQIQGARLAKVVIVRDDTGRDVMAVLPANHHLDLKTLHRVTGRKGFHLEDERELRRLFPDCEVGAMPPVGSLYGLAMYVDPCLLEGEDIFFQAGNHLEIVLMRCQEYRRIAHPYHASACLHRHDVHTETTPALLEEAVAR